MYVKTQSMLSIPVCARVFESVCVYLHVVYGAWLGHTQHVEQLQDELFDVLQGVFCGCEVGMHLHLHLGASHTHTQVR